MTHPALISDSVAVITGGAAGIGFASAKRFAAMGMALVIVDNRADLLPAAADALQKAGARKVMTASTDVADADAMKALEQQVADRFGGTDILMNNAGIQPGSSVFSDDDTWHRVLNVNLWGIMNGSRIFGPRMVDRARPGMIVNTGSKQGITTPPGDPVYNVAKAGAKAFTEALEHELRNTEGAKISAHLLIPGHVFTDLTARGRTEKPDGAWTADQTADFFIDRLNKGDFYILCPDGDVDRALDEKRMAWAMGDVIENRPPLSRWHSEFGPKFEAFIKGG
ncbi:SDR family NAD(P)-dependent oxidoreductase [bacterium]|nr:SDR family NAD(P)-dependent oxidoreductase [bacterium]